MKNITKILLLIGLFSIADFAQTKPKPKTAAKLTDVKSVSVKANVKTTNAKTTDKKTANAKPKNLPKEKVAPEKPQSGKTQAAKPLTAKEKTAKTQTAKVKSVIAEPAKKIQTAKSQTPTKIVVKSVAKSAAKPDVKSPLKAATKLIVKPVIKQTANEASAKPIVETPLQTETKPNFDVGEISGKTYHNKNFNFAFTVPEDWEIADDDFTRRLKKEGFDLSVETPKTTTAKAQIKLNAAVERVHVVLTAYKASQETNKNAILRVSIEDLRHVPQIKDAVDYFDSMRATYQNIKLPVNFKYSETQAEKLGAMQFGFLDVTNGAGKKRMYATVRSGYAIMFTLTYKSEEDLAALKTVLADGDFRRR